jgi:predicted secreted Zn-dependent protease
VSKSQQVAPQSREPEAAVAEAGPAEPAVENSVRAAELADARVPEESESSLLEGEEEAPTPMDDAGAAASVGTTKIEDVKLDTYSFTAKNLEEAYDKMLARDATEFGRLAWDPKHHWEGGGKGGTYAKCDVVLAMTKTMPSWTNVGDAPAADQKEWKRFYAALDSHEDGHAQIARDHFTGLGEKIGEMKTKEGNKLWADTVKNNNDAQKKYDATTQHGKTQGTDITLPGASAESESEESASLTAPAAEEPPVG